MADDGIEYLVAPVSGAGASGDHGDLTGLADDDHPQYETSAEAAAKVTAHEGAADPHTGYLRESVLTTKGDVYVATAAGTVVRVGIGSDGQHLVADSSQAAGVRWVTVPRSLAEQHGVIAESFDNAVQSGALILTAGTIYATRLYVPKAASVTKIVINITTAGSTLTSGQNLAALYDDAGTKLQETADQTTPWASAGLKEMAITSQAVTADTFYRVLFVANGTTPPTFARGNNLGITNTGLAAATYRSATAGTAQTALPATITPGSLAAFNTAWMVALI